MEKVNPLIVKNGDGKISYGGDQGWFNSNTKAYAGCGSVAAVNVLRILCDKYDELSDRTSDDKRALVKQAPSREEYLELMEAAYGKMRILEVPVIRKIYDLRKRGKKILGILVPSFGIGISGFIIGTLKFARDEGILLHSRIKPTGGADKEECLDFLKEGLDKAGAVVILTCLNKHNIKVYGNKGELFEGRYYISRMKNHFATITGLFETDGKIYVKLSTWGKPAVVPYDVLSASWKSVKAYGSCLFYFTPVKSESVVRSDIRRAPALMIWSIISGIIRGLFCSL